MRPPYPQEAAPPAWILPLIAIPPRGPRHTHGPSDDGRGHCAAS
jgi:hypothetical protein